MAIFELMQEKRNKIIAIVLLSIIAISLLIIFVVRPLVIGYSVYQNAGEYNFSIKDYSEDVTALRSRVLVAETNLSSCTSFSSQLFSQMDETSNKLMQCKADYESTRNDYEACITDSGEKQSEREKDLQSQLDDLADIQSKYNELEKNAANNICCKARVDNPNIKYYSSENNKISCLEQGTKEITC